MPTPRPISDASCVAKSGVSTRWLISVMTPSVVPSASSVAISGSPAATSEPKVMQQDDRGGEDPEELRRALAVREAHDLGARAAVLDLERAGCAP